MISKYRHFNRLAQSGEVSVDLALAAALPTVGPSQFPDVVRLLLKRGHAQSCAILIERFDSFSPELQSELLDRFDALHGACREAARHRGTAGPRKVVELISQTRSIKLIYLVAEQLRSGPVELRRAAAQCLLDMTQHALELQALAQTTEVDSAESLATHRESVRLMRAAVEEALLLYRHHHQPGVLLAFAMLLPGPCEEALIILRDPRQAAVEGMRQLILDANEPPIVRQMLRWLGVPTLLPVAAGVLPRLVKAGKLHQILEQGQQLLLGTTRQAVAKLTEPRGLIPTDADQVRMSPQAALWLSHWLTALPMDESTRIMHLSQLRVLPDACARLATLRQLIQMNANPKIGRDAAGRDELHAAIAGFCIDENESIARIALRHLLAEDRVSASQRERELKLNPPLATARRHATLPDDSPVSWAGLHRLLLDLAQNARHESIRELARAHMVPIVFEGLWRGWPRMDRTQRKSAAMALAKLDERFEHLLRQRLIKSDLPAQMRALDIIATLGNGALFEPLLLSFARATNDKLAASAVRALASVVSQAASDHLQASLAHRDARVRANAVEALGTQQVRQLADSIRAIAAQDHGRPRANAIVQLIKTGDGQGITLLREMLADHREGDRISALWAVQGTGRIDAVAQVAELALSDADPTIRKRATQTLKSLLARMSKPASINLAKIADGVDELMTDVVEDQEVPMHG